MIWIGFSKDKPRIITVSDSGHVTLTDMSGKIVSESLATEGQISCCVSDKGGNTLWIGTADGELVQWAIRESEAISRSKDHQRAIRSIELTANGLLTIAVNEHPRYWQINPLKSAEVAIEDVVQADMAQVGKPRSVLIALDERKAPRAYLVDHDAGGVKPLLGDKMIRQAKFSPDCKRLLVLLQTGTVQVLSAETLAPISEYHWSMKGFGQLISWMKKGLNCWFLTVGVCRFGTLRLRRSRCKWIVKSNPIRLRASLTCIRQIGCGSLPLTG